jgi:ATP-dependent DNA ligase
MAHLRFIEKNLKVGAAEKTMQAAMAKAFFHYIRESGRDAFSQTELEEAINRALCEFPNYEKLVATLMKER